MKNQPNVEIAVICITFSFQQSGQLKPLLSLYIQDTVQKVNHETTPDLKMMVVRYLEQTTREMHVSSREGQPQKPFSGGAAVKGKLKGKGRRISGGCVQRTTKGQCSRGDKCGMKHDSKG